MIVMINKEYINYRIDGQKWHSESELMWSLKSWWGFKSCLWCSWTYLKMETVVEFRSSSFEQNAH